MKNERSKAGIRCFQFFAILGALNGLVGTYLIIFQDVETVMGTGPAEAALGLVVLIFAVLYRHPVGIVLGVSMIGISLLLFGLVLTLDWSPADAELSFSVLSSIYMALSLPMVVYVLVRPPVLYHEWQCTRCGYPIVRLTQPRCPECGSRIEPVLVEKYAAASLPE
ncbi:MAG: hypothetical protein AAGI37_15895 [Planctomycetota bacterium]